MSVEAKLSMTLDEIIQKTTAPSRGRKRESVGAGPVRSSKNNSRSLRNSAQPYETKRRSDSGEQISLKILVSTAVAGILIGKGGTTIQTLSELTSAKITVAGSADLYPGISQRVVQISGTQTEVKSGLKFVIECIALEVRLSDVSGNVFTWNPRKEINRGIERTDIECLITVPAAAAGGVIGRGGATLRSLSEDSGAVAIMSGKEEAAETQERVITVSGTTASCRGFANRLVGVLAADPSTAEFAFTGGKYGARPPVSRTQRGAAGGGAPANKQGGTEIRLRQPFPTGKQGGITADASRTVTGLDPISTITVHVDDSLVGAVVGAKGATLQELIRSTGTTITLSKRGEFLEGTRNRIVTITGSLGATHDACTIIQHLVQQAQAKADS